MMVRALRPFSRDGLPWVRPDIAGRSGLVCRWIARKSARPLSLRGVGSVSIEVASVSLDGTGEAPFAGAQSERFRLGRAGAFGEIAVDSGMALAWVFAVLGAGRPRVVRPLGRTERGVLSAALSRALDGLGLCASLSLGPSAPLPAGERVAFHLLLHADAASGPARLEIPLSWLHREPAPTSVPPSVQVEASFDAARTLLSRLDLEKLAPGDAVVFDGHPPFETTAVWQGRFRLGSFSAPAEIHVSGAVQLTGPFELGDTQKDTMPSQDSTVPGGPSGPRSERPAPPEIAAIVSQASVEVVAEFARLRLRADEIAGLVQGAVLSLGRRRADVTLRVGNEIVAHGELVNVDNELAVRVTAVERR